MSSTNEEQVKAMLSRSPADKVLKRWISCGNTTFGVRINWVSALLAIIVTWGFAIICLADKDNAPTYFGDGKTWVSQNFTWLYILTQDVWCLFLIYLAFSRFAKIKLGGDDEKPHYNDFTWFCMLFTCGVAVGLYVFGVAEPLYFYRQPTSWLPGWSYAHTKVGTENDAMRAQQAIFMAVYHWGIHGWVPYILLALTVGVVSYRWKMPMTIRSCFYPLLGDHALGLFGDIIDALSVSTTTFGVCTSLGLGVTQLSSGLGYVKNINCSPKANCIAAGGTWDISGYGAENCALPSGTDSYDTCSVSWLATPESTTSSLIVFIIVITLIATLSVLSGIDRGIKTLASLAFLCGMVVCISITFADNTWYLLNVMVQTTGYYLQYVIQVGFDCEAFQQQAFEWYGNDKLWMTTPTVGARVKAVGLDVPTMSPDCGTQTNPCSKGWINAGFAAAMVLGGQSLANTNELLTSVKMSPNAISVAKDAAYRQSLAYSPMTALPCGSGWDTAAIDEFTQRATGSYMNRKIGDPLCDGETMFHDPQRITRCKAYWEGAFPVCPETTIKDTALWGSCDAHALSCPIQQAYYGDTNPEFMNWWTIFYWAWWITWAPFVGFFVALISRGRTVREVIVGGFVCPTLFAILWFSVFGGLAIKMERTAEMALKVRPDVANAGVTCTEHYSGKTPISPDAKKLSEAGYYMLSCLGRNDQIYMLMEPYANLTGFLHFFLWIGLVIYFLTSSDSGSMTDDMITAGGLSANKIPHWQKIFWCFTEGLVALALIFTGGALGSLQALSIVIGLPYTVFLCMMVPACYRALKKEAGDTDIAASKKFNTQLLDFLEFFKPNGGSPCTPGTHLTCILKGLFCPAIAVKKSLSKCFPDSPVQNLLWAATTQILWLLWFVFHIAEGAGAGRNGHVIAWLCFIFMLCAVIFSRVVMRYKYNVWGSPMDDLFASLFLWPVVLAQLEMCADTDGKDAPAYWASADEMIETLKQSEDTAALPSKVVAETATA